MVDGHLFTLVATLAAELRKKSDRPFGGMQVCIPALASDPRNVKQFIPQLVVTGDFFQLPPVTKGREEPFFAFESEAWKTAIEHTVNLTRVFRQKDNSGSYSFI